MDYTLKLLMIIVLINEIFSLGLFLIATMKFSHEDVTMPNFFSKRIYVLLPIYREQSILQDTLLNYERLTKEFDFLSIIVITTEREEWENQSQNTTSPTSSQLLRELAKNHTFIHLHSDQRKSSKSIQLNFAIKEMKTIANKDDFIYINDFDAKITRTHILSILSEINLKPKIDLIQQIPMMLKMPSKQTKFNPFVVGEILCHAFRAISLEWSKYYLLSHHIWLPKYTMGTGLALRFEMIQKIGGFPLKCDDLPLIQRVERHNGIISFSNQFIMVEPTYQLTASINQYRAIYNGLIIGLKESLILGKKSIFKSISYFIFWLYQIIEVSILPFFLIWVALESYPWGVILVGGYLLIQVVKCILSMIFIRVKLSIDLKEFTGNMLLSLFFPILRILTRALGFLKLVLYELRGHTGHHASSTKTPRYYDT